MKKNTDIHIIRCHGLKISIHMADIYKIETNVKGKWVNYFKIMLKGSNKPILIIRLDSEAKTTKALKELKI